MTPFIIILSSLGFLFGTSAVQMWFGQREWVARWRGHYIRIFYHQAHIILEVDDARVLVQKRNFFAFRKRHAQPWSHPAMGETEIVLSRLPIGSHGEYTRSLQIGDDLVPLTEVPRTWVGARAFAGLKTVKPGKRALLFEKISHGQVEELGDPRWVAACRILRLVRNSHAATDDVRGAANRLQMELRKTFEARHRLGEGVISELGQESDEFRAILQRLEGNVLEALEAVKSLHMAVISIEAHADESLEMQRVRDIIEHLQAEEEVARFVAGLPSPDGADEEMPGVQHEEVVRQA